MDRPSSPSRHHSLESADQMPDPMLRNKGREKSNRMVASTSSLNQSIDATVPDIPTAPSVTSTEASSCSSVATSATSNPTASFLSVAGRSRRFDVTDASDRSRLLLASLNAMGLSSNQLAAYGTLVDLPASMRLLHPLFQNISDFGYEFDSDGILRNVQTGESLSMKVTFTGAALKRQEMIRAICTRQVRQRLFDLNMESSQIPIPGHPTLCMRVLHSVNLFTHRGPVLVVLQAGGVAQAGVWANRLLLHPQHGLRTGSQLELIRKAHERGFAVALINANEHVPSEAEMDAMELVSALFPTAADAASRGRRCDTTSEGGDTDVGSNTGTFRIPAPRVMSSTGGTQRPTSSFVQNCEIGNPTTSDAVVAERLATAIDPSSSCRKTVSSLTPSVETTSSDGASNLSNSALYTLLLLNSTVGSRLDPAVPGPTPMPSVSQNEVKESMDDSVTTTVCPNSSSVRFIRPVDPSTATQFPSGEPSIPDKLSTSGAPQSDGKPGFAVPAPVKPVPPNKTNVSSSINRKLPPTHVPPTTSNAEAQANRDTFCPGKRQRDDGLGQPQEWTTPGLPDSKSANATRPPPWSSASRCMPTPTEPSLDVSSEDRLYGIWRQLIPHLASDQIMVWAHQHGGYALLHPFTPMPGLWPGFPDEHQHHQQSIDREHCAAQATATRTHPSRPTESGVYPSSATADRPIWAGARCTAVSFQPSEPSTSTSNAPINQLDSLKQSLTSLTQTLSNSLPSTTAGESELRARQSTGSLRPKPYATRKRHMSANAILSTCPIPATPVARSPVSAVAQHRPLAPLNEHGQEAIEMTTVHEQPRLATTTRSPPAGSSIAVTERIQTPFADVDQLYSKDSVCRPWLDRRVYGPWRYHVSPDAARRAFHTSDDANYSEVGVDGSCVPSSGTESQIQPGSALPLLSGDPLDTELFTQRGGVVSRNAGVWASGDVESSTAATTDDGETLRLRLARAWQRKARRLQAELVARVKLIVFTDCPTALDLALEGVGWGLMLLQDHHPDTPSPGLRLFQPSILQSGLPERVTEARKWFAEHSVHFVAADSPIGTRLDEGACRAHQIPVLSAGTTEHDLIPSSVLDTVFDLFKSKLDPLSRCDSNVSDASADSSHATTITPDTNENPDQIAGSPCASEPVGDSTRSPSALAV